MKHSYWRYFLIFTLAYIGFTILMVLISNFLPSISSAGAVLVPFVSAMMAGGYFVKHERRAPDAAERSKLIWGSFAIYILINALMLLPFILTGRLQEILVSADMDSVLAIATGVFAVMAVIVFFLMRWAYGGLLRKQVEKMRGRDDTFD